MRKFGERWLSKPLGDNGKETDGPGIMSKDKRPSLQFYPGDWQKDGDLRRCSHAAKGVWIDILCLMFECEERGVLATAGTAWTDEEIAQAVGGDRDTVLSCIHELTLKGVAQRRADGALYSKRMVRDEHKRRLCSEAGKRGGNPTLKGVSKGSAKGGSKRNPTPSSSTSSSTSVDELPNGNSTAKDSGAKKFIPPTLEQVQAYCDERSNGVDPAAFINHYQAKGWMIGHSKMKDWQAAVRTWEATQNAKRPLFGGSTHRVGPGQRFQG